MNSLTQLRQLWTKYALAEEFGIDYRRVTRLLAELEPERLTKKGHAGYYLKNAVPYLFELNKEDEGEVIVDPEKMAPKSRKDWYDGTDTKVKLERKAGLVIPAEEVRRGMATLISNIIQEIENLPDLFERDCGFSPEAVQIAQDTVDRVRELAYERVSNSRTEP